MNRNTIRAINIYDDGIHGPAPRYRQAGHLAHHGVILQNEEEGDSFLMFPDIASLHNFTERLIMRLKLASRALDAKALDKRLAEIDKQLSDEPAQ